ncbi:MAG: radical SAM family heme chaperone HemW [Spirochaetales bacterium]|nr:radical SAM family heme chaperone HemW [Spirochaetales bacterium]
MEFDSNILPDKPYKISLYIHIPFCIKKCLYCDFFSVSYDKDIATRIIDSIISEIRFFFSTFPGLSISTIYIGGGTPSCLPIALLEKLLKEISLLPFYKTSEFTIEANPESMTKEFLLLCKEFYVTRLSIGIQTTDNSLLSLLGRIASFEHIEKSKELLRLYWQGDLSVDLISGIPGQTYSSLRKCIHYCIQSFHPSHISLYSLTIEPGTRMAELVKNKSITLPPPDFSDKLWFKGYSLLESKNFINYEISNFAQPGKESLHNIGYWNLEPYVGIGPGGVSTLPGKNDPAVRISHSFDINRYSEGRLHNWGMIYEPIDTKSFIFETCMMGFRLSQGINKEKFDFRFGISLPELIPLLWEEWIKKKWIQPGTSTYALTKTSRFLLNDLLLQLSDHLDDYNINLPLVKWP